MKGRFVTSNGGLTSPFLVACSTFVHSYAGRSPQGFLAATYLPSSEEYLAGMSMHLESLWGYLSLVLVQRINRQGQLLRMNGARQHEAGVGYSIDYQNDDQIGIDLAVRPAGTSDTVDEAMAVYSKHQFSKPSQDFDIWSARIQVAGVTSKYSLYVPSLLR